MARPRLVLNIEEAREAYESSGSIRGAAKGNRCARSVAARTLRLAGEALPDRDEGYRRSRLLKSVPKQCTKSVVEKTEQWGKGDFGVSEFTYVTDQAFAQCIVDHCFEEATKGRVCGRHHAMLQHPASGKCPWPKCPQEAMLGEPVCFAHAKRLRGEID